MHEGCSLKVTSAQVSIEPAVFLDPLPPSTQEIQDHSRIILDHMYKVKIKLLESVQILKSPHTLICSCVGTGV